MDAQQFLADFGHIANAPNGIARLREMVLVLAMQGAFAASGRRRKRPSSLMESIAKEKLSLIASRTIRPPKSLPDVAGGKTDRTPFQILGHGFALVILQYTTLVKRLSDPIRS